MNDYIAPERFQTDDFVIRSYLPGDGAALREAVASSYEHLKSAMHWVRPDPSLDECETSVRRMRARYLLNEDYTLGIWAPHEGRLWGGTGFHLRDGPAEWWNAEIGMWIRADRAHRGLGTRVLEELIRWGFSEWPWQRLSWRCDPENLASVRVAEKVGLEREGVFRSRQVLSDGSRRDSICFATLRPNQ